MQGVIYAVIPHPYTYKPFAHLPTVTVKVHGRHVYLKFATRADLDQLGLNEKYKIAFEGCVHRARMGPRSEGDIVFVEAKDVEILSKPTDSSIM